MITQKRLKELLVYDPVIGNFTWKVNRGTVKVGDQAGGRKSNGYWMIKIDGKLYLAHRLAWLYLIGEFPADQIDHINGKRSDNRWINLRSATASQNQHNATRFKNNTSGYKGVSWNQVSKKWQSQIWKNGKHFYLGSFHSKEEAYFIYCKKAKELHGEFANFV